MQWFEALILGLLQGLTEFLPVSSSGHLELGKAILGVHQYQQNLMFTVVVHGATVLSTIVIFWKDILNILKGILKFKWNEEMQYAVKLIASMIPVVILGLLFEEQIEQLFSGNLILVGSMLIITAALLAFTYFAKPRDRKISFWDSIIIGFAQALAVMPGVSRSGATISTALLLGNKKINATRFSFLMVLLPILGANGKKIMDIDFVSGNGFDMMPMIIGFITAFLSGLFACKLMIRIVKNSKLIYFAIYCLIIGLIAIIYTLLN